MNSFFDEEVREILPFDGSAMLHPWVLGDLGGEDVRDRLIAQLPWQSNTIRVFGVEHVEPRLVSWHGDPGAAYSYSGLQMTVNEWTPLLLELRGICERLAGTSFNSVLVNLYRDGNDKVGWHADDEPELGPEPVIASLSLGATRRFRFRHRETGETVSTELGSGSLVVMSGLSQKCWVHEVPRQKRVTAPRINLTFRRVRTAGHSSHPS